MKTLLFQGDSITDCGRQSCGGAGFPLNQWGPGYPGLIASRLMGDQPGKWNIINRGISGNRIVDLYARWRIDGINLQPDIISILIGINDVLHEKSNHNGVDLKRFDQFYRMILDWTLETLPSVKFILLEPFAMTADHFDAGYFDASWMPEIARRRDAVRKIAEDYHTAFVPLQSVFDEALTAAPAKYWMVDGVHPQPAGHRLVEKAWFAAAADLLKD